MRNLQSMQEIGKTCQIFQRSLFLRVEFHLWNFRDVTFGYDEHVVLEHLNFKVMDTDQVTLLGRTGAGKSTILKLLLGLYQPDQGEVLIHGMPTAAVRAEERRKLFGYVEQSFHMVPGTVRDQITSV